LVYWCVYQDNSTELSSFVCKWRRDSAAESLEADVSALSSFPRLV